MALDPSKWTTKTQQAVQAAIEAAKAASNPELTPDHLMGALMRQDDTIVPAVVQKLGLAPLMLRNRADEAVAKLPARVRWRRAPPQPGDERRLRPRRGLPQGAAGRLPLGRAPAAGHGRPPGGQRRGAARRAARRPRQPSGHVAEPRGPVPGPREVRPGPHPAGPGRQDRPGHRSGRGDPTRHPGALAAHEEQPGADRRAGRREDGHRRGPGRAHRGGRRAGGPEGQAPRRARHRRACWPAPSTAASSRSA